MGDHTLTDTFWNSRPALQHVLQSARAAGAGPWSVLGSVAARAIATIPPEIVLPPTIGGRMSLNIFIAHVGPSGGGKGIAEAVANETFHFGKDIEEVPLGSGEGVARTFRPVGTKPDDPNALDTALFTAAEIDTVTALASRAGSTLSAELRKMYSGEKIGFGNAGKDTRVVVAAHTYRACLTVGVQPLRSKALLDAADGGLPQRFVWLPTSDPDAPDDPPAFPGRLNIKPPHWLRPVGKVFDLHIPAVAKDAIRGHRLAVLREDPEVNPLDGHALLTRLKMAVGLMALDGRSVVSDEDWTLAGYVMAVSDRTRERCQRVLAEQSQRTNTARALASAERDEIVADRKMQRARETILRKIDARGQLTKNQLRQAMKADIRDHLDPALCELLDAQEIAISPGRRGTNKVHVYHRYTSAKQRSNSDDGTCTKSTRVPGPSAMPTKGSHPALITSSRRRRTRQQTSEGAS